MTPEEKQRVFTSLAVIEEKVSNTEDLLKGEIKPDVKKNTRFRIMITGFVLISIPIFGLVMKAFGK